MIVAKWRWDLLILPHGRTKWMLVRVCIVFVTQDFRQLRCCIRRCKPVLLLNFWAPLSILSHQNHSPNPFTYISHYRSGTIPETSGTDISWQLLCHMVLYIKFRESSQTIIGCVGIWCVGLHNLDSTWDCSYSFFALFKFGGLSLFNVSDSTIGHISGVFYIGTVLSQDSQ